MDPAKVPAWLALLDDLPEEQRLIVTDWLLHAKGEKAKEWKATLQRVAAEKCDWDNHVQERMFKEHISKTASLKVNGIRHSAKITKGIHQREEAIHGKGCWRDPEWLADTKKKSPQLFYPEK